MSNSDITKLRHSAAHLLAMAVLELYKDAKLGQCGITDSGFYYDIEFDEPISSEALPTIQAKMLELAQANLRISLVTKTTEELATFFTKKAQPYKRELLDELNSNKVEVVVIGDNLYADICSNKVVNLTSQLENVTLTDVSGAYWKGDDKRAMLTRINGVCFETAEELNSYKEFQAELIRRDHRIMGKKLGFFTIDPEVGTGLVFWTPRGRYIRDALAMTIKERMIKLGDEMIETPLLSNSESVLLVTQPKSEQVIAKNAEDEVEKWYAIRQQVLGSHLKMYKWKEHSYRDLPWRVGELAKLVRFEKSGELEGLHRSREITQDTTTIICTPEQLEKELDNLVAAIVQFARDLGFASFDVVYRVPTATTRAQKQNQQTVSALVKNISKRQSVAIMEDSSSRKITEPEIVLTVVDSLKQRREWSKIQVLFDLPVEQNISYVGKDGGNHSPVVLRATICGSLERVIATLIEHYAGLLPLWMTYEHARVIPVTSTQEVYAEKVAKLLNDRGVKATTDLNAEPLDGKIRQAEEEKIPYMLIVGEKEQNTNGVSVRVQGHGDIGLLDIETFIKDIQGEVVSKSIKSPLV